jgi:hypothetical protein
MTVPASKVFGKNDFTHGLILEFAFEPGDDIQIGEGTGFNAIVFQVFDFAE